jgi:nucleoside-diphosphate-sugar epimerase
VTGAGGLIGRAVLQALPTAADVVPVRSSCIDLLDPGAFADLLRDTVPAVVIHLAWSASSSPGYRTSPDNARWRAVTREAAYVALGSGIRFIAVGSVVDDARAEDPYTEAKAGLRSDLTDAIVTGQVTWLRPHYVFDPDAPSPAVLRDASDARERGRPVDLREPHVRHDFVHVRDVADAVAAVVEHRLTGVVDIGSGLLTAVHTLVERFGASWTEADGPTTSAQDDSAADVGQLLDIGWHPTETVRFLS